MNKLIIDTNALISFVTDRNPVQQAKIAGVFDSAARLRVRILCAQNVLTEFVYVMDTVYGTPKTVIREIVKDFANLPGVEIVDEINLNLLFRIWPDRISDYGDAIVAALCKDIRGSSVATFDRKLKAKLKRLGLAVFSFEKG